MKVEKERGGPSQSSYTEPQLRDFIIRQSSESAHLHQVSAIAVGAEGLPDGPEGASPVPHHHHL